MTDRMTIVPLPGPVRSLAMLGGGQSASRFIGQAARPRRMLIRGRAHCGHGAYRHRLR
jgi:hypothetical protein